MAVVLIWLHEMNYPFLSQIKRVRTRKKGSASEERFFGKKLGY